MKKKEPFEIAEQLDYSHVAVLFGFNTADLRINGLMATEVYRRDNDAD